jgi:hypothetical protein
VDLDDRAIAHGEFQVWIARERVEDSLENIGRDPMPEPIEHRAPDAEDLGTVRNCGFGRA